MSWDHKDPNDVDWRYFIWCDEDGTNDGSGSDDGKLQGETISSHSVSVSPSGELTVDTSNTDAVTIRGVSYDANTVVNARLSAGTANEDYTVTCQVVTSAGRTLERSERQSVKNI